MGRRSRSRGEQVVATTAQAPPPTSRGRRRRPPWSQRERLGHEAPGSVLRGPPITVDCDCGEHHEARYGEQWTCPSCGRRWDTTQIPREEYERIRRLQLRFRLLPIALGLVTLALAAVFTLTGNVFSVFLLLPITLLAWFMILRPLHRTRFRRAVADLPRWTLRPEASPPAE